MKNAIIDIGSNSVRLFLADGLSGKKYIETTMLAHKMRSGMLDEASIERTVDAIDLFIKAAADAGFPSPIIFATEALRAASNQETFLRYLRYITDLPIDILSGEEEASIAFLGAAAGHDCKCGVIDIGGASVEYAFGKERTIVYKKSIPLGAITLKNLLGDDRNKLNLYLKNRILEFDNSLVPDKLIGVSGTLTSLAAMDLNLKLYDPEKIHNHVLTMESLERLEYIIFSESGLTERYKTLSPRRAEIIKQGISIIINFLRHLNKNEIIISEKDNLEGYILYKGLYA